VSDVIRYILKAHFEAYCTLPDAGALTKRSLLIIVVLVLSNLTNITAAVLAMLGAAA
jgi:hypothetical protein